MNYKRHHDLLIERARSRVLSGYVEVHHVVPRCMGGGDEKENLVALTPEEHFVVHQLLCKMYPDVRGLAFALTNMIGNPYGHRSNKFYGWIRKRVSITASAHFREKWKDPEYKEKVRAAIKEVQSTPEYKAKISKIHKGRVKSDQERANIAEAGRKRKRRVFSEQARRNMAEARRKTWEERRKNGTAHLIAEKIVATRRANGSYEFSEEWRQNIGKSAKGRKSWNKGRTGVYSEETLQKMRDAKIKHSIAVGPSSDGDFEDHTTRMRPA